MFAVLLAVLAAVETSDADVEDVAPVVGVIALVDGADVAAGAAVVDGFANAT